MARPGKANARTHRCPHIDCQMAFSRRADLKRHFVLHLSDVSKHKHKCPYNNCSFQSLQKSNLNTHIIAIHLKEKPHRCPEERCEKCFADGASLNRHLRHVHQINKGGRSKSSKSNSATSSRSESPVFDLFNTIDVPRAGSLATTDYRPSTPALTDISDSTASSGSHQEVAFLAEVDAFFQSLQPELEYSLEHHNPPPELEKSVVDGIMTGRVRIGPYLAVITASGVQWTMEHNLPPLTLSNESGYANVPYALPFYPVHLDSAYTQQEDLDVEEFMSALSPDFLPFTPGSMEDLPFPIL